ncbi:hypothetical protein [Peribacillus sp. SCS-155]|uniref:hypothetical protein n=1 Tax=Peribacillus sedimenti TaxID=3115297 RepID=UPI003906234E
MDIKTETQNTGIEDNNKEILNIERQLALGIWIKVIGQIIEAISLSRIFLVSEEIRSNDNEQQILSGVYLQTVGQFLEAIGITNQVLSSDEVHQLQGQKITVTGDWLQALGLIVEANAGSRIIGEEERRIIP